MRLLLIIVDTLIVNARQQLTNVRTWDDLDGEREDSWTNSLSLLLHYPEFCSGFVDSFRCDVTSSIIESLNPFEMPYTCDTLFLYNKFGEYKSLYRITDFYFNKSGQGYPTTFINFSNKSYFLHAHCLFGECPFMEGPVTRALPGEMQ